MSLIRNSLLPLFLSQSLRSVAVSLLSFFSAIYIYKQTSSVLMVIVFFLILYVFKIIGVCLAENFSLKIGLKKQILIGQFLTALTLVAFSLSFAKNSFLWLAGGLWGLAIGFFWFGRHGLLIKKGEENIFGQVSGIAGSLETLFILITPFLGGLLIEKFGYFGLFYGAIIFVFLAIIVILTEKEEKIHYDTTLKEIYQLILSHKKTFLAYFGLGGIEVVYSVGLILYIFFLVKKEISLGEFFSLSLILVAFLQWLIGEWTDKKGKEKLILFGSITAFWVWFLRLVTGNISFLLFLDVVDRVGKKMMAIPLEVLSFQKAIDGKSTGRAILFREVAITSGSIFTCFLFLILVFLKLPVNFSFLIGAGLSLFPVLLINKK